MPIQDRVVAGGRRVLALAKKWGHWLRAWSIRRLPGLQMFLFVSCFLVLGLGLLGTVVGSLLSSSFDGQMSCGAGEGKSAAYCERAVSRGSVGFLLLSVALPLLWVPLLVLHSLVLQWLRRFRDARLYGPRCQSIRDWYAHGRIHESTYHSLHRDLEHLVRGTDGATAVWATGRTLTNIALGFSLAWLMFAGVTGFEFYLERGSNCEPGAPSAAACQGAIAIKATIGTILTVSGIILVGIHALAWPLRISGKRRRLAHLADLDAREEAALHEAYGSDQER